MLQLLTLKHDITYQVKHLNAHFLDQLFLKKLKFSQHTRISLTSFEVYKRVNAWTYHYTSHLSIMDKALKKTKYKENWMM